MAQTRLIPHLSVVTRCHATEADARRMYGALMHAREQLLACADVAQGDDASLQAAVVSALGSACSAHGVTVQELGLSYCPLVTAYQLAGPRALSGSYGASLLEALRQRRLLLDARELGWVELRRVWMEVMQMPVQARASRVFGRAVAKPKAAAEAALALDQIDEARKAKDVAEQAKRQQRTLSVLETAARAVAAALAQDELIHSVTSKRKRCFDETCQRRRDLQEKQQAAKRRWQWLKDPERTMNDLLRGSE